MLRCSLSCRWLSNISHFAVFLSDVTIVLLLGSWHTSTNGVKMLANYSLNLTWLKRNGYFIFSLKFYLFQMMMSDKLKWLHFPGSAEKCPPIDVISAGVQKPSDMEKLISLCSTQHRRVTNVLMDGNSLFSALALQLRHSQAYDDPASFIRAELVEHLRSHPDNVRAFWFANCFQSLFMTLSLYWVAQKRGHLCHCKYFENSMIEWHEL